VLPKQQPKLTRLGGVSSSASEAEANASDNDLEDDNDRGSLQKQHLLACGRVELIKRLATAKKATLVKQLATTPGLY
jgi:hypothetical protein